MGAGGQPRPHACVFGGFRAGEAAPIMVTNMRACRHLGTPRGLLDWGVSEVHLAAKNVLQCFTLM